MVSVNANLDLKSFEVLKTGRLNEALADLCDADLGITFVARDRMFLNEAWQSEGKTFMRVVLPYEEVLTTNDIDLLAFKHLYIHLDRLDWLEKEKMKVKLQKKITQLESSDAN